MMFISKRALKYGVQRIGFTSIVAECFRMFHWCVVGTNLPAVSIQLIELSITSTICRPYFTDFCVIVYEHTTRLIETSQVIGICQYGIWRLTKCHRWWSGGRDMSYLDYIISWNLTWLVCLFSVLWKYINILYDWLRIGEGIWHSPHRSA